MYAKVWSRDGFYQKVHCTDWQQFGDVIRLYSVEKCIAMIPLNNIHMILFEER